jgi:hypothetical protein
MRTRTPNPNEVSLLDGGYGSIPQDVSVGALGKCSAHDGAKVCPSPGSRIEQGAF